MNNTKEKLKQVMLTSVFHMLTIVAQQHGRISLLSTILSHLLIKIIFQWSEKDTCNHVTSMTSVPNTKSWYNLCILVDGDIFGVLRDPKKK